MSKYSRNKTPPKPTHCSCCRQKRDDVAAFGGGLCEPCEQQHTFAKRSGAGLAIIKPKVCPGPGVKMTAEEVVAMNGIGN